MNTERFIRLAAGLHVLAALSFPLVLLTPHHDDTASQVFLVALLVAGTWARTWSLLHAEGSASWATTFRDGGVIAVAALLACWSTLASGALLGREGLLSLRSDSAWEHVLVPVLVRLLTSLICYLTPLLVAAPLLGIPLGLVHVARSVHRERLSGGAGPVGLAAEWTGALPPVERATVRKASADTGRNLGYDPMLVAGIWAARRPVSILALGAHGLGFDLLVLAVVRSAPPRRPVAHRRGGTRSPAHRRNGHRGRCALRTRRAGPPRCRGSGRWHSPRPVGPGRPRHGRGRTPWVGHVDATG